MIFYVLLGVSLIALLVAVIYEVLYTYRDGGLWK